MKVKIEESWAEVLSKEFDKPYFKSLTDFVKEEYQSTTIYPEAKNIFNAFNHCPFHQVKVVLLGQDPYHGAGQAHGLAFSVKEGISFPPSLNNIFKELKRDLNLPFPANGSLERWAEQGVFLLNATLTVRAHQAASHQNKGWEEFTDAVIRILASERTDIVFMLWGAYARKKAAVIPDDGHLKLYAPHPSPLSAHRGFIGCGHFSDTNKFLQQRGITPIVW